MTQEATIRRGVRNARYAAIPNHVFEDSRLSMEARWLLGYLLSKPDNWVAVIGDIIKKGNCGRDKARKMIAELVDTGYAEREQQREDGKFGSSVLVIFDEPREPQAADNQAVAESVAFLPQTDLPATAMPATVLPSPAKSALSNNLYLENTDYQFEREREHKDQEDRQETPAEEPGETRSSIERAFKRWFPTWPTYVSDSEDAARRAWFELTASERDAAAGRTADYLNAAKSGGRKIVCSSAVYLRERRWLKLPERQTAPQAPAVENPFGKAWGALRLADLLGPHRPLPAPPRFVQQMILDGKLNKDVEERDRLTKFGWPSVNEMHERAASYRGVLVPTDIKTLGADFSGVQIGGDLWAAWKRAHEVRGWPWLPDTGKLQFVYFPAVPDGVEGDVDDAVQAAIDDFSAKVRGVRGDEHAA